MTKQELLCYRMTLQELEKWQELCISIRAKFAKLNLPALVYEELERRLLPGTPYTYAKGYSENDGYFYVEAGDRGNSSLIFKTTSREEAEHKMIKSLAHAVSYQYNFRNQAQIELEKRGDWRFYNVVDGRKPGRIISHEEENPVWNYDTKYDYRKYWFEMALRILKETVPEKVFQEEAQHYEELLNRRFDIPFWQFDTEQMVFVCIK